MPTDAPTFAAQGRVPIEHRRSVAARHRAAAGSFARGSWDGLTRLARPAGPWAPVAAEWQDLATDERRIMRDHAKVRRSGLGLLLAVLVLTAAFFGVRYLLQDGDTQQPAPVGEAVRHGTSTDHGSVVRGAVGSDRVPAPGDGDYVFRVRFTDPAQQRAGQVVIVPSGQRFTTASSARQLGVSAPGEALSVGATAIEGLGADHGIFALVLEQTAFPFRDVGTRQYECLVPALCSLAFVCRDGLGQPVEGVRIALSGEALPRSAMDPDGAGSLALALAAGAAIHTRTSEANGRAAFGALAPGSYCFDVSCRGMALVGSPDPEQDRLRVPGAEVLLTLQPMAFLVARATTRNCCR